MGSIPLPALHVNPPADPSEGMQRILAMKGMMQQQAGQQQEQQARAIEIKKAQQQQADQQTYQQALASTNGDAESALKLIAGKVNPQSYNAFLKSHVDTEKELSEKSGKDFDLLQKKHSALADIYQQAKGLPDDQYAQAWPQIASRANEIEPKLKLDPGQPVPKQALQQMGIGLSVTENYIKSEAEKRAAAKAPLEQAKLEADTAKSAAEADKAKIESEYMKKYGYMTPGMAESRYLSVQGKVNQGLPVTPDDKAFKAAYEKNKTLVPSATFNLNNTVPKGEGGQPSAIAQSIAGGQMKWGDAVSPRTPMNVKEALLKEIKGINPNFNSGDFTIEQKVKEAFTSGQYSQQLNSINRAREHMGTFLELAKNINNTDSQAVNRVKNAFKTQFGSEAPTDLNIAKQAFASEVGKSFAGANVALADRQELDHQITNASSWEQLHGAAKTADTLLEGAQKALKQTYESGISGKPNFGGDKSGGKVVVTAPDGSKHPFDTQAQADAFKKLANIP